MVEVLKKKNNMAKKPTLGRKKSKEVSDSTDNKKKKFEDMTLAEKMRAAAEKVKNKKRNAQARFDPNIDEASTDDPSYAQGLGRPVSPGSNQGTETIKTDSGESFMKRMKRLNQESPTKLVEGEHDSVTDLLSNIPLGTTKKSRDKFKKITTTIYDKIKKSLPKGGYGPGGRFPIPGTFPDGVADKIKKGKKIPSTPTYAPKKNNKGAIKGAIDGVLGRGVTKKIKDLFGK